MPWIFREVLGHKVYFAVLFLPMLFSCWWRIFNPIFKRRSVTNCQILILFGSMKVWPKSKRKLSINFFHAQARSRCIHWLICAIHLWLFTHNAIENCFHREIPFKNCFLKKIQFVMFNFWISTFNESIWSMQWFHPSKSRWRF